MSAHTLAIIELVAGGYIAVGSIFAWRMAISPPAIVALVCLWPLFAVLLALAPVVNWWVNREFEGGRDK